MKRLAASFEVAARSNDVRRRDRKRIVAEAVRSYRLGLAELASESDLEVWYRSADVGGGLIDLAKQLSAKEFEAITAAAHKATTRDSLQAARRLVATSADRPRFRSEPPLLVPLAELITDAPAAEQVQMWIDALLADYQSTLQSDRRVLLGRYRLVDIVRKVVGVGSVGTRAWVLLMMSTKGSDPLILQAKEASKSVLEPYSNYQGPSQQGQRVVEGQRLLQSASDVLLGWQTTREPDGVVWDYYVRQLRDGKGDFDVTAMSPTALTSYARSCGWTLARAHAQAGDRAAIAQYLGTSDRFEQVLIDSPPSTRTRTNVTTPHCAPLPSPVGSLPTRASICKRCAGRPRMLGPV